LYENLKLTPYCKSKTNAAEKKSNPNKYGQTNKKTNSRTHMILTKKLTCNKHESETLTI